MRVSCRTGLVFLFFLRNSVPEQESALPHFGEAVCADKETRK